MKKVKANGNQEFAKHVRPHLRGELISVSEIRCYMEDISTSPEIGCYVAKIANGTSMLTVMVKLTFWNARVHSARPRYGFFWNV